MKKTQNSSIRQLHKSMQTGDISCEEIVSDSFTRIEKYDPKIKAFLTLDYERALRKAKKVDEKVSHRFELTPLEGIPYSAKDVFCTKDVRTTAGSKMLEKFIPPYDATVIKRMDNAGAILIGKTNCDAFGFGSSTENSGYYTTHNPYDLNRVPGGSSGGSAAAVSMGMGVCSVAEDTGGSIRQPSAFCNVSGIKVTYGRVSRYGSIAYGSSLDTVGHISRYVEDLALLLEHTAGLDDHDSTTVKRKVPQYSKEMKKSIDCIEIGIPKEYFETDGIDNEVKTNVLNAAKIFEKLGCHLEEISLPHTKYAVAVSYLAGISEVSANLARYDGIRFGHTAENVKDLLEQYTKSRSESFEDEVKRRIMLGTYALSAGYYEAYYEKAMQVRAILKREMEDAYKRVDVILSPVAPTPPFEIGLHEGDPLSMWLEDVFTMTLNPTGCPGLAIPCDFSRNGLPIGLQIYAPQFEESILFQMGYHFQKETDYHTRLPRILSEKKTE